MKLPDESAENIRTALTSKKLLSEKATSEVVEAIAQDKNVNWNLVLTTQFKTEQGGQDETAA